MTRAPCPPPPGRVRAYSKEHHMKRLEALAMLEAVEENSDGEYTLAALAGIGYALLDVADAIREQTQAHQAMAAEA